MRASTFCARGIKAENAKVDILNRKDRLRMETSFIAEKQSHLHLTVFVMNNIAAELATDGSQFQFANMQTKQFLYGPATPQNIARLTTLDIPVHVLVSALLGQAPVLKHDPAQATIEWSGGHYVVRFPGTNDSSEELQLDVHPDDWNKPFAEQRLRVIDVLVKQKGYVLYHADFDEHKSIPTSDPILPEIPGDPTIAPSGPACTAEIPMRIHVEVPEEGNDVRFRYDKVWWNPPLLSNVFTLSPQAFPGIQVINVANIAP